jgi:hypothetical protein
MCNYGQTQSVRAHVSVTAASSIVELTRELSWDEGMRAASGGKVCSRPSSDSVEQVIPP